jgi:hypothetical protein
MPDLTTLADRQEYSDLLMQMFEQRADALSDKLTAGDFQLIDFQVTGNDYIRKMNAMQLIAGAGGKRENVKPNDWLKLGTEIQKQQRYFSKFCREILAEQLSSAQIKARMRLYARSTQAMFWRQALPVPLPAQPRDGSTPCRTSCLCFWTVDYEYDNEGQVTAVLATWNLGITEDHCDVCPDRAAKWNPLRVPVGYSFNQTAELLQ